MLTDAPRSFVVLWNDIGCTRWHRFSRGGQKLSNGRAVARTDCLKQDGELVHDQSICLVDKQLRKCRTIGRNEIIERVLVGEENSHFI